MSRIALFRYHKYIEVCRNHIQLFRKYNPDIRIYGIFGGKPEEFDFYSKELSDLLAGNYCLMELDEESKWKNFDYALREWYKNSGKDIDFGQLYLIEWDFVLLDSIDHAYRNVPMGSAGFSGLIKLKRIERKWYWTGNPQRRKEWIELMDYAKDNYRYSSEPYGILCPGLTVPRRYLDGLLEIRFPDLGNDELRFPLYAQLLDINIEDTRFYRKWFSKHEWKFFNCNNKEVRERTILRQLIWRWGRRAFHPFRGILTLKD
jgi:hypothetical protein